MTLPLSLVLAALASASLPVQAQYTAYDLGFGDAYAINSSGTVVGFSGTMETHRAFSYSGGVMTDLGTLGGGNSVACSINNFGVVAGRSDISSGSWRGFSYSGGHMTDLGCFRCHDGKHVSADGRRISKDCNSCHTIVYQGTEPVPQTLTVAGLPFQHPEDIGDAWQETNCVECHSGL